MPPWHGAEIPRGVVPQPSEQVPSVTVSLLPFCGPSAGAPSRMGSGAEGVSQAGKNPSTQTCRGRDRFRVVLAPETEILTDSWTVYTREAMHE
jgi:hypothetical protein